MQVRSLGSLELREDELTPENSSKAVNRCIVQLSSATKTTPGCSESAGQWGAADEAGKELTLELSEGSLRLLQPSTELVLTSQPIHSIRKVQIEEILSIGTRIFINNSNLCQFSLDENSYLQGLGCGTRQRPRLRVRCQGPPHKEAPLPRVQVHRNIL